MDPNHQPPPPEARRCLKVGYPSKREAQTVINRRMKGRQRRRNGAPDFLRSYHCPFCGNHHITHQEDWFTRPAKRKGNPRRHSEDPCELDDTDL